MTDRPTLPLQLEVPGMGPLVCERALRILPGQRWTLAGRLPEQADMPVVAKLYLASGRRARRHFERERRGLEALYQRGIAAPELLFSGQLPAPAGWLVLTALLGGEPANRMAVATLPAVLRAVALHHADGVEQTDAHLGNFLIRGGVAWTLDGAGIRAGPAPLPARRALRNLARWLAQIPPSAVIQLGQLYTQYRAARWDGGRIGSGRALGRALKHERRKRETRHLKKVFRDCTAFSVSRSFTRVQVLDRRYDTPALRELLANPDAAFAASDADWLKRGNSASVVRVLVDGRALVLKRYNLKSPVHWLRRFWRPSRAWHSWRNAQRLVLWGVPTATPVAVLENRLGWLRGRAWYVSEFVPGVPLHVALADTTGPPREVIIERLHTLLTELVQLRLSHGDLKATNFLFDPDRPLMLLDLDAMRRHRRRRTFSRAFSRDLQRLRANWAEDPPLRLALDDALTDIERYL
ncbi:lipopolysaccharide kinase InaA family protein [Immundisolibacter sp.]|uniref:lipopolysaccharide kinase InaA family protein n=2 Tax=Immundisolibacter sp. TaxID=1934948 RepID=UPI003563B7C4